MAAPDRLPDSLYYAIGDTVYPTRIIMNDDEPAERPKSMADEHEG